MLSKRELMYKLLNEYEEKGFAILPVGTRVGMLVEENLNSGKRYYLKEFNLSREHIVYPGKADLVSGEVENYYLSPYSIYGSGVVEGERMIANFTIDRGEELSIYEDFLTTESVYPTDLRIENVERFVITILDER